MNRHGFAPCTKYLMLAAGALIGGSMIAGVPAIAQQTSAKPEPRTEITVIAPYVVRHQVVGRETGGVHLPIEVISVSRNVSYADLDLAKHSDAAELEKRISDTAKAACDELNSLYPNNLYPPVPSDQNCVKSARDQAMTVAKLVIAAAGK